jgi:hypothetical protein
MDRIGSVPLVDEWVGPRPQELVGTGVALKAAVLNARGFLTSPLYLFGHFWESIPPDLLNAALPKAYFRRVQRGVAKAGGGGEGVPDQKGKPTVRRPTLR